MKQILGVTANKILTEKLWFFSFFVDLDRIAGVYEREKTPAIRSALADFYQELTGDNIENNLTLSEQLICKKI